MPVSRKAVVGAKYIYGVAVVFLVVLLETVSYLAFQNPVPETARNVGFTAISGLICVSIFLPFVFWLGAERGRTAYVIAMGVFCALTLLLKEQMSKIPSVTIGAALVISLILTAVSYWVSVVGYTRREF